MLNTIINVVTHFKTNRFHIKYMLWNNFIMIFYIFFFIFVILGNIYPSYLFNDVVTIHSVHLLSMAVGIFFISNILFFSDLLLILYLKKEDNSGYGFIYEKKNVIKNLMIKLGFIFFYLSIQTIYEMMNFESLFNFVSDYQIIDLSFLSCFLNWNRSIMILLANFFIYNSLRVHSELKDRKNSKESSDRITINIKRYNTLESFDEKLINNKDYYD